MTNYLPFLISQNTITGQTQNYHHGHSHLERGKEHSRLWSIAILKKTAEHVLPISGLAVLSGNNITQLLALLFPQN